MVAEIVIFFIDKLETIKPEDFIDKDVALLYELGKRTTITNRAPEEHQIRSAAIMW